MIGLKFSYKHFILLIVLAILFSTFFIDSIGPLKGHALNTLAVVISTLMLLVFDVFPVPITCLLSVIFLLIFSCVDSINEVFVGYSNPVLYFTLASFGISTALASSSLLKRMLAFLINRSKKTSESLLFMIMFCTTMLSSIISDVAAVVLFIPVVLEFLNCFEDEKEYKVTKRTFFIGLLLASMIGGMMTPAGSSINLLTLNALDQYSNTHISFVQWMGVGIPTAMIVLICAYNILRKVFPPANVSSLRIVDLTEKLDMGKLTNKDKYIMAVVFCTITAWILSSWIPQIHIAMVAIIALALLFIPQYNVLTWDEFNKNISWETFFIAGTMITLADCVVDSKLAEFLLKLMFPQTVELPFIVVAGVVAAITFIFMIFIPSAPASVSILAPFVIAFAMENSYNPAVLTMICGMCVCNCYLLPLDTPAMVTYSYRAFKVFELPRVTLLLQLIIIVVMAIFVTSLSKLLLIQ